MNVLHENNFWQNKLHSIHFYDPKKTYQTSYLPLQNTDQLYTRILFNQGYHGYHKYTCAIISQLLPSTEASSRCSPAMPAALIRPHLEAVCNLSNNRNQKPLTQNKAMAHLPQIVSSTFIGLCRPVGPDRAGSAALTSTSRSLTSVGGPGDVLLRDLYDIY